MAKTGIKQIEIFGLFDEYDFSTTLDSVNIFVGENGMGKTTILNIIYCVLSDDYRNLRDLPFKKIKLTFTNSDTAELRKLDIIGYSNYYDYKNNYLIESSLSIDELRELMKQATQRQIDGLFWDKIVLKVSKNLGMTRSNAENELIRYVDINQKIMDNNMSINFDNFRKKVRQYVNDKILYFPTYRRIEEDIKKLGIDNEKYELKNHLINFGMGDVERAIKRQLDTIRRLAIDSFSSMSGILLKQYLNDDLITTKINDLDIEKINIIFSRIGDKITKEAKNKIIKLIKSKEINNEKNKYLLNLIQNLIKSFKSQNEYDEKIKNFVEVCNKYLTNKKYYYDESELTLNIYKDFDSNDKIKPKKKVNMQHLSSGEKQLISIFSKLYLSDEKDFIILFDEPELSLSIIWQKMFLPDIVATGKCKKLIAVTHSPFIFDNEYDSIVKDIGKCFR